ncbi:hypothetical protein Glove_341g19 [Diversispora epigaea]|uniref:TLDc domain-containing protein n=1 Tax=Diversispora epigaea TaxID=1348612 RepID=A0A397HLJ3_9GLOM|nr:hypothetical protein Glove_341g19 [Diversispora epigaea]
MLISSISFEKKLRLILEEKGSVNGFAPQTFWDTWHDHSCTVVIMKVEGTDEIFGGYNPLTWDANTNGAWIQTKDSFIFSLKNDNIQN